MDVVLGFFLGIPLAWLVIRVIARWETWRKHRIAQSYYDPGC